MIETEPHEIHKLLNYPNIGPRESYLIYHEELESLVKHFPSLKRPILDDLWAAIFNSLTGDSNIGMQVLTYPIPR